MVTVSAWRLIIVNKPHFGSFVRFTRCYDNSQVSKVDNISVQLVACDLSCNGIDADGMQRLCRSLFSRRAVGVDRVRAGCTWVFDEFLFAAAPRHRLGI